MRSVDDFLPAVLPYATTCPETTAVAHIIDAARLFCQDTRCWREVSTFRVTRNDIEVVCVPPYADLHEIEVAQFNGRELERAPYTAASGAHDDAGDPTYISEVTPNAVRISPQGEGELVVSVFLMPSLNAELVPDFLVTRFRREVATGALATLLLLPNQSFTNPVMAGEYERRFTAARDKSFNRNIRGQQRAPARARPSFF